MSTNSPPQGARRIFPMPVLIFAPKLGVVYSGTFASSSADLQLQRSEQALPAADGAVRAIARTLVFGLFNGRGSGYSFTACKYVLAAFSAGRSPSASPVWATRSE